MKTEKKNKHCDDTKVYKPHDVVPLYENNIIVDTYAQNSKLLSEENAELSEKWVNDNEK